MRRISTAALTVLLALPAFSQQKLVETIEVRVANVDVVVRDKAGHAITGLTKDDFELFEEGVPQKITNFYEVRRDDPAQVQDPTAPPNAVEVPVELRQRRLVLFVDCASLQPARKRLVLAAVEKFVDRMQPEDQAMLVAWRLGLQVVTPFTHDKAVLKQGIVSLERMGPAGEASESGVERVRNDIQQQIRSAQTEIISWPEAYAVARTIVDRHAEVLIMHERPLLDAVDRMVATLAGLEGKKVLVLVSAFLPERPGAELYRYVYDQFAPYMDRNTTGNASTVDAAMNLRNSIDLQALTGVMGNSIPDSIEQVGKRASANGVIMYPIDAAEVQNELSAANNEAVEFTESFSRHENTASALKTMAAITGGVAITQASNYDSAFDTINRDLDSYYSLGFKPIGQENLAARKIVVKVKGRKVIVRARENLLLKTAEDQMNDRVIANLYSDGVKSAWPISVKTGMPRNQAGRWVVPVQVVMASTITLLPQDQNLVGGLTLYFAVGKGDGRTSEVIRKPRELKIPASAEPLVRAKPITFTTAIGVNAGESVLSIGVIDQVSGTTGYTKTKIVAR
jgi:VWFA-related protein